MPFEIVIVGIAVLTGGALLLPVVRKNDLWRATVTPLASIIGSGFLVAAPILSETLGQMAVFGMAGLCAAAWLFGMAMRFNIAKTEDRVGQSGNPVINGLDRLSALALAFAYFISVAYYVNLLSAFALRGLSVTDPQIIRFTALGILAVLGGIGLMRGLKWLEGIEVAAVGVKLGVIIAVLAGLALSMGFSLGGAPPAPETSPSASHSIEHQARVLLGLIILVQGFETSRYLGSTYSKAERIRTMRWAQIIATGIYIAFIALALPWFHGVTLDNAGETAVIDMLRPLAAVVGPLLIVAALMSQLSASVADMNGSSGLIEHETRGRLGVKLGYALTAGAAIGVTLFSDIFEIISHASRAFAAYYALQSASAAWVAFRQANAPLRGVLFSAATVLALAVVIFGLPAE